MRRLPLPLLLGLGLVVGIAAAFGLGVLLGDARHDDRRLALAPAGEPVPVAVPTRVAPEPTDEPTDEPSTTTGASEDGGGTGAGGAAETVAEPAPALTPVYAPVGPATGTPVATADDTDPPAEATDPTDASGSTDPSGTATTTDGTDAAPGPTPAAAPAERVEDLLPGEEPEEGHFRFTDPCAGAAPGDAGPEGCPEGTGAAVLLDDDLPTPPALAIDDPWMGPAYLTEDRCRVGVDDDGTIHAVVFTNVPATLTLTLDVRGEHHEVTAETSPEERLRFTGRLLDGERIDGFQANAVQTCVSFESVPTSLVTDVSSLGPVYWYEPAVEGTDDAGTTISHPPGFLQMRVVDRDGRLDPWADAVVDGGEGGGDDEPFALGGAYVDRIAGGVDARCPIGPDARRPARAAPLRGVLTSSVPGTFRLSVVDRGAVVPMGTFETDEDERRLHDELLASGEAPTTGGPAAVQTCFDLGDLGNAGRYYLDVAGTDDEGRTVTGRLPFTITDAAAEGLPSSTPGRPEPVVIERDGVVTILLAIDESSESIAAHGLARTGDRATGDSCTDVENRALGGGNPGPYLDLSQRPIPRLGAGTLPGFVPPSPDEDGTAPEDRFDTWQPIRVLAGEGDVVDVCTWVTTRPRGSFDPTVEERRQLHVRAPRRLRVAIDLRRISAAPPVEDRDYTITAVNWPGQPSRVFPTTPGDATALLDSGAREVPEVTHLRLTHNAHGHAVDLLVQTPTACLVGRPGGIGSPNCAVGLADDVQRVALPDNQGDLCITDCHGVRHVTLAVRTYVGPGGPPGPTPDQEGSWVLRNDGSFGRGVRDVPVVPRADLTVATPTPIAAEPGGRPGMRLVLPFDRPVDVTVVPELVADHVPSTCTTPAAWASTTTAARHEPTFTDLCFGAHYRFAVTATDPVGGGTLHLPGPVFAAATPGLEVGSVAVSVDISSEGSMRPAEGFDATVDLGGGPVLTPDLSVGGPCLDPDELLNANLTVPTSRARPVVVGDLTALAFTVDWTDCDGRRRRHVEGGRPVALDELLAGPVTYTAHGDGLSLELTLTVTPLPSP